jgi:hypothetical protein
MDVSETEIFLPDHKFGHFIMEGLSVTDLQICKFFGRKAGNSLAQ